MEYNYISYTKKIENTTYYFIKKMVVFPELKNVPPFLEAFGMNADFDKACTIAKVEDREIKQRLLNELESSISQAKIIDMNESNYSNQKIGGL